MAILLNILKEIWLVTVAMAPYLLFGFLMAGVLSVLISKDFVRRHLGGRGWLGSLKAALVGIHRPDIKQDIAAAVAGVVEAVGREPEVSNADGLRHDLVKGVQDRAVRSAQNLDAEPVCRAVVDLVCPFIDRSRAEEINAVIDPAVIRTGNSG